jgi:hypothetical protein
MICILRISSTSPEFLVVTLKSVFRNARDGSKAATLQDIALEPPRRFATPFLTQEGDICTQISNLDEQFEVVA